MGSGKKEKVMGIHIWEVCGGKKEWPVESNRAEEVTEVLRLLEKAKGIIRVVVVFCHFPSQASSFSLASRRFCSER